MPELVEHVAYLSQEIGPRPAGTEEEQQAALYITEQLQKEAGLSAVIEDFNSASGNGEARVLCCVITLVATVISFFFSAFSFPAVILTLLAAALYVAEAFDHPILSKLFARGVSQNIVAKYEPGYTVEAGGTRRRKVILMSRYDSGKARAELNGPLLSAMPALQWANLGAMIFVPLILLVHSTLFFRSEGTAAAILNVLTVIALVLAALPLVQMVAHKLSSYNEGANCNAAGTAVLLETARRVGRGRVSEAELAARDAATIHGEEAARAAGLVPEGAQLVYEASQVKPPDPTPQSQEARLASAKAAVAALSGAPVSGVSASDIAQNLVQIKEPPLPSPSDDAYREQRGKMREAFAPVSPENAQATFGSSAAPSQGDVAPASPSPASTVSEGGQSAFAAAAAAAAAAEAAEAAKAAAAAAAAKKAAPAPAVLPAQPVAGAPTSAGPVTPLASAVPSAAPEPQQSTAEEVPDWFKKAQEKAKKPVKAVEPAQRSRYASALDAAVSESARYFAEANDVVTHEAEERIEARQDDIHEVKAPQWARPSQVDHDTVTPSAASSSAPSSSAAPVGSGHPAQQSAPGVSGSFESAAPTSPAMTAVPVAPAQSTAATAVPSATAAPVSSPGSASPVQRVQQPATPLPVQPVQPAQPTQAIDAVVPAGATPASSSSAKVGAGSRPMQVTPAPADQSTPVDAGQGSPIGTPAEGPHPADVPASAATPAPTAAAPAAAITPATPTAPAAAITPATPTAPAVSAPEDPFATTALPPIDVADLRLGDIPPMSDVPMPSFLDPHTTQRAAREAIRDEPPRTANRVDVTGAKIGDSGRIEELPRDDGQDQTSQEPTQEPVPPDTKRSDSPTAVHRPIVLPDVAGSPTAHIPLNELPKQRAPLAEAEASGGKTAAKSLLNMLPAIDLANPASADSHCDAPGAHPSNAAKASLRSSLPSLSGSISRQEPTTHDSSSSVSLTGSFVPVGATGTFAPVGDELIENVDPSDVYVDDADDSDYEDNFTETGAFAGPGYVDMPKSRVHRFLDRFHHKKKEGKKKEEEATPQEWLQVDDSFDARTAGAERGGWESFRQEDEGATPAVRRSRPASSGEVDVAYEEFEEETFTGYVDDGSQAPSDDDFNPDDVSDDDSDDDGFPSGGRRRGRWQGGAFSRTRVGRVDTRSGTDEEAAAGEAEGTPLSEPEAPHEIKQIYQFRNPDINTEVWFVALGAELADHGGIRAFLNEHQQDLHGAILVDLDALGAGSLSMVEREGAYRKVKTSSRMKRYIKKASQATGLSVDSAQIGWQDSAASYAIKRGFQAMHLVGMDGTKPALFAQKDDVLENIDDKTLSKSADFVMELLKNI